MNADKTDLADLRGFLSQKNQIRVNPYNPLNLCSQHSLQHHRLFLPPLPFGI